MEPKPGSSVCCYRRGMNFEMNPVAASGLLADLSAQTSTFRHLGKRYCEANQLTERFCWN